MKKFVQPKNTMLSIARQNRRASANSFLVPLNVAATIRVIIKLFLPQNPAQWRGDKFTECLMEEWHNCSDRT